MGQKIKSFCVCQCVCPSASTLMVAFLDRFSPKLGFLYTSRLSDRLISAINTSSASHPHSRTRKNP